MDEDEDMQDQEEEQVHVQPGQEAIKFGEARLATEDARAAGVAKGNVQVYDADTLELPEVGLYYVPS